MGLGRPYRSQPRGRPPGPTIRFHLAPDAGRSVHAKGDRRARLQTVELSPKRIVSVDMLDPHSVIADLYLCHDTFAPSPRPRMCKAGYHTRHSPSIPYRAKHYDPI